MAERPSPAYGKDQISLFENYVQLPKKYEHKIQPEHTLAYLSALHVHMISTIPYENLSLHYSETRVIDLNPQRLFTKLITEGRGRGGYCMEVSIFFNHVLRALGFNAYMAGVRIRLRKDGIPSGDYIGWTHIVSIVTLPDDSKYMVDVAFGGDGATKPMPMIHGHVVHNLGPQEVRLVRDHITNQVHRTETSKLWIYQYRNGYGKEWHSFYAFPEFEFLEPDFKVMNWYTSTSPDSFQRFSPLVVKFLRGKKEVDAGNLEVDDEIIGKRMLVAATVKENLGGKTRTVQECKTEHERVEALEKWFQLRLSKEEKAGIQGHWTEIQVRS
ncbi:Arylamine N-acetyltransferase [Colletotrichum tofieldiae]|uniref:Arylamine N-acetyltransferase n=1 Tax=Colletotrichum tofieldiae TaxID=708197 RepID=A0A166MIA7_9PEZI|nr:Arylamine N-acetyltransferase [Colletotrichum tofieldiae]